jgi:hypothetical protein
MTAFTGSLFFPGGIGTFTAPENEYLEFELGPTETIVLQWATYYDAADEAGISRLYGGIHVSADDLQGRIMGSRVGLDAFDLAMQYFDGLVINSHPRSQYLPPGANTILSIEAKGENLTYQWFKDGEPVPGANASYFDPGPVERLAYYHVDVQGEGGVVTSLPCHLSPTIFHADLNLGNGNRSSPWLGRFNDLHFPFVNHPGHGWIYCAFEDSAGGWLYHYGLGWCWTSSTEYPYIYVLGRNDWLLYVTGTEDPAWYYSFDNGSWLNF